ncbi:MAG: hypothetical protein JO190_07345 [Candidatus Eremiobacteraeota bacterium]|nr:hypothetical protein [Candidatus Eremiobacteraeota bacterium]MBV8497677.1 hypothetical protein [Candidatus Eremiobacteraeota bacterium]
MREPGSYEYSHDGRKIGFAAYQSLTSCAVDRASGDIAFPAGLEGIAIFSHGRGRPKHFYAANMDVYSYCGYDNKGNLFVMGFKYGSPGGVAFALLHSGHHAFTALTLNHRFRTYGGEREVQWDGRYWAVLEYGTSSIYRFAISGSRGIAKGRVKLVEHATASDYWIQGSIISVLSGDWIKLFKYPAGGRPVRSIGGGADDLVVSLAPN